VTEVNGTLVDTNVLFDLLSEDQEWADWSAAMLSDAAEAGPVVINPIIYAELAVRYDRIEDLDIVLPTEIVLGQSLTAPRSKTLAIS